MKTAVNAINETLEEAYVLANQIIALAGTLVGEDAGVQTPKETMLHCGGYMGALASTAESTSVRMAEARSAIARIHDAFEGIPNVAMGETASTIPQDLNLDFPGKSSLTGARRGY